MNDIVIDRSTVAQTCINGSQWYEEDFDEDQENEAESEPDNSPQPCIAKEKPEDERPPSEAEALAKKNSDGKPNETISISAEEARKNVQAVIKDWILESCEGRARRELGLPESG